jgi:hypothetical protein
MVLDSVFQSFLADSPACVMTRAILEHGFSGALVDALFDRTAQFQYTRELHFSSVVEVIGRVVFRQSNSVGAAHQELKSKGLLGVSSTAVYDKINGLEPAISAELVRVNAARLAPCVRQLGARPPLLPGLRLRIIDGNHFAATEHRLAPLRTIKNAPLPAQAIAVYEPDVDLVTDIVVCEDAHAQERSMTPELLELARPGDCFLADRNFCTKRLAFGLASKGAFFLFRQHKTNLSGRLTGQRRYIGRVPTGAVYEQQLRVEDDDGRRLLLRRVTLMLDQPTRDGETELHLVTNVPKDMATALVLAVLYQERWTIEGMFQTVTVSLRCELATLARPRAAILAFCVAITGYHVLALQRAAIRAEHGKEAEEMTSDYYLADEIAGTMRGMLVVLPAEKWSWFRECSTGEFTAFLREAAARMNMARFRKHPRGPKRPAPKRHIVGRGSHVATKRILDASRRLLKSP